MADPFLVNTTTHESSGTYFCVLQRWIKQACINASITIPMSDPLLRDLTTYDSEGTRFAVLQRWLTLLANNITGGGGGSTTIQSGSIALVPGQYLYPVTFSPAFASIPSFLPPPSILMPNGSAEEFGVAWDNSTLTAAGCTAVLDGVPTAASNGGFLNWGASK